MAQNNLDLTPIVVDVSSATTTQMVVGTASWKNCVYRLRLTIGGANVVTIASAANVLEKFTASAAGLNLVYDYDARPWYTSNPGEAINLITTTSAPVTGVLEYIVQT